MSNRSIIDIHLLQTLPPSNVNRDDTGSPKSAVFGGVRRARVSSQAWKRSTRVAFEDRLDDSDLGVRTARAVEYIAEAILRMRPEFKDSANDLAAAVLKATGIKVSGSRRARKNGEPPQETGYLLFLSRLQIEQLARAAVENAPDGDPASLKGFRGKGLLSGKNSIDLALFGRMVADVADLNVDASVQVAHAISVHGVETEYDYFTAVDDAKREEGAEGEDAGAAMIGTVEFNSSTLYRYATLDANRLFDNLGDLEATARGVDAFLKAFIESMPTGKQNTFANRTLPDAVVVMLRDTQPINLVGAFEDPVEVSGQESRLQVATDRLLQQATEIDEAYGQSPVAAWVLGIGKAQQPLREVSQTQGWAWTPTTELPTQVAQQVRSRLESQ